MAAAIFDTGAAFVCIAIELFRLLSPPDADARLRHFSRRRRFFADAFFDATPFSLSLTRRRQADLLLIRHYAEGFRCR
jgi:hypothetical protein